MANELISALTLAGSVTGSEDIPVNLAGVDYRIKPSQILTYTKTNTYVKGAYEGKGLYFVGNALHLYPTILDIEGSIVSLSDTIIKADITTGLTAATWYAVCINVLTNAITLNTIVSLTSWSGTTLATNRLNMLSIYDSTRFYCYAGDGSNNYRIIGFFKVNAAGNGIDWLNDIKKIPPCIVYAENKGQSIANSGTTVVGYDNVYIDTHSIISGSTTTFKLTCSINGIGMLSANLVLTPASFTQGNGFVIYENGMFLPAANNYLDTYMQSATFATQQGSVRGSRNTPVKQGQAIQILSAQSTGGAISTSSSDHVSILSFLIITD